MRDRNPSDSSPAAPVSRIDPSDTIFRDMSRTNGEPITGETINILPTRSDFDLTLRLAQFAMAAAGAPSGTADSGDLILEDGHCDPANPFQAELLERIRRASQKLRVLVIQLPLEVPSGTFLRELAAAVADHAAVVGGVRPQLLRYEPIGYGRLPEQLSLAMLLAHQSAAVVIIPCADRRLLGLDLVQLARTLAERELTILAATHLAPTAWHLGSGEIEHWVDLSAEHVHSPRFLTFDLLRGFVERHQHLPPELRVLRPDAVLPGGRKVLEAAALLGSPLRVRTFFQMLDQPGGVAEFGRVLAQAVRMPTNEIVRRWYEQLDRRDQLLAVALGMLEHLPEVQMFPALEELFERVWNLRGPGQPMLDLVDLQPLRDLFAFYEHSTSDPQLEPAIDSLRIALLAPAVTLHRRHLQYALLWLVRQILTSLELGDERQHPTYGPPRQHRRLRTLLMAVLADVALVSPGMALPALLSVVAMPFPEAQRMLARALGRWNAHNYGDRLVALLSDWPHNPRICALVSALRGSDAELDPQLAEATEQLRSVALLAYTEAARSVPSGTLNQALVDEYARLISEVLDSRTIQTLRDEIIPILLPLHIAQISPILHALAQHAGLRAELSNQLVMVYQSGGERMRAVHVLIQGWLAAGLGRAPERSSPTNTAGLIVVAGVLGAIDYRLRGPISREGAWRYLELILKYLEAPDERAMVLAACMRLAGQDPGQLRWALREIRLNEQAAIVADLTEICRQQRAYRLAHGHQQFWHDGIPKSPLEQVLIGWLLSDPYQNRAEPHEAERLRFLTWETLLSITRQLDLQLPVRTPHYGLPEKPEYSEIPHQKLIEARLAEVHDPQTAALVLLLAKRVLRLEQEEPQVLTMLLEHWAGDLDLASVASGFELLLELSSANAWETALMRTGVWFRSVSALLWR